ncbi:MAG TPA: hypothetical protein VII69_07540 [Candidatus Eremiobacteraceae bacterium]
MSGSDKGPSADMLLVEARRRRLLAGRANSGAGVRPANEAAVAAPRSDPSKVIVGEEDAFVEDEPVSHAFSRSTDVGHPQSQLGGLHCYRPLATVTLARLAWSGVIDHAVLQEAIACAPFAAEGRAEHLIRRAAAPTLRSAPLREPSLFVRLGDDDVEALELALESATADIGGRLASAALLPEALIGAPPGASYAASQALASYRGASLVAAWREIIGATGLAEVARDRDSAAVRLLSTLRALLGEA